MRFKEREDWTITYARLNQWHRWFAWRPVRAYYNSDHWQWVWLEDVGRKGYSLGSREYRTIEFASLTVLKDACKGEDQ